jgi:hypothetical protein
MLEVGAALLGYRRAALPAAWAVFDADEPIATERNLNGWSYYE